MIRLLIGVCLVLVTALPSFAAPGDPRFLQGTVEWPSALTGEPVIIVRGDDGRVYSADVGGARRHGSDVLKVGTRVALLVLEGTRPYDVTAIVIGAGDAASLARALSQGGVIVPAGTTATAPAVKQPAAVTPLATPLAAPAAPAVAAPATTAAVPAPPVVTPPAPVAAPAPAAPAATTSSPAPATPPAPVAAPAPAAPAAVPPPATAATVPAPPVTPPAATPAANATMPPPSTGAVAAPAPPAAAPTPAAVAPPVPSGQAAPAAPAAPVVAPPPPTGAIPVSAPPGAPAPTVVVTPPGTPAATPSAPAPPPAVAPAPSGPSKGNGAAAERKQWARVDGKVQSVEGALLVLRADNGSIIMVDISQLNPNISQSLRRGRLVSVYGYPLEQKFEAAGYIELDPSHPEPPRLRMSR